MIGLRTGSWGTLGSQVKWRLSCDLQSSLRLFPRLSSLLLLSPWIIAYWKVTEINGVNY